ncbi:MAG: GSCFA domain-containing protein [Ferruginibacter sp.]
MKFHAEFTPKPLVQKINHKDKLLLLGSCFTEQIGAKLSKSKFDVLENPHGIVFNPISIAAAIRAYCKAYHYKENDLFFYNELWGSWHHHTKFSSIDKNTALQQINQSQKKAIDFIKNADWILLTLGSAFVYEREDATAAAYANVVANCHKYPTDKFNRRLLEPGEIMVQLSQMMDEVWAINAKAKFIFTISPVRHLREGFVENNRSKAALIQAVHNITSGNVFYFPAYELVIDDLRDYRFYAEDMVHPNYAATNYVWEKFISTCIDEQSQKLMDEINIIHSARHHKAFNPASEAHKLFLKTNYRRVKKMKDENPYINFSEEAAYFSS